MCSTKLRWTIYTAPNTRPALGWRSLWRMNASFICVTQLSSSHPSVLGFKTVSSSLFSAFPAQSICSAIIHESSSLRYLCLTFSSSPSLILSHPHPLNAQLSFQPWPPHYPPLPIPLFNPQLSFALLSTKANNTLQCFHHQQSVFPWHRRDFSSLLQQILLLFSLCPFFHSL